MELAGPCFLWVFVCCGLGWSLEGVGRVFGWVHMDFSGVILVVVFSLWLTKCFASASLCLWCKTSVEEATCPVFG